MGGIHPHTLLRPTDLAPNEHIVDWLPTVGGLSYAAHSPHGNRIAGVRMKPHDGCCFRFENTSI